MTYPVPGMTPVSIDCEFIPNNLTSTGLISMAVASETATFYAVNADMDTEMSTLSDEHKEWMRANVWKYLPVDSGGKLDRSHPDVLPYPMIRDEVSALFKALVPEGGKASHHLRLCADHGTQDVVRLHTLWDNNWNIMPAWIPKRLDIELGVMEDDLKARRPEALMEMPEQDPATEHHALYDAKYDLVKYEFLRVL